MLWLELAFVFVSIGVFCFGGGYVIIPLIQQEIVSRGWMNLLEFADIIAVSESTPGPLSINAATYVGFKLLGIPGALLTTLSLMAPAFVIVLLVSKVSETKQGRQFFKRIMVGIRPVVVGLIFYAAYAIAATICVPINITAWDWWITMGLAFVAFVAIRWSKIHPIVLIGGAAFFGAFFFV